MHIEIEKINENTYRADILELPGSPSVGQGKSPEEATANVFITNIWSISKFMLNGRLMFEPLYIIKKGY